MKTLLVFNQDKAECVSSQGEKLRPDAAILGVEERGREWKI